MKTTDRDGLIAQALKAGGWDGLCNGGLDCACFLGDLVPCDEPNSDCCAGRAVPCDGTCEMGSCDGHITACERPADKPAAGCDPSLPSVNPDTEMPCEQCGEYHAEPAAGGDDGNR